MNTFVHYGYEIEKSKEEWLWAWFTDKRFQQYNQYYDFLSLFYSDCFLWVISIIRQVLCAYYFQVQILHGKVIYFFILKIKITQG